MPGGKAGARSSKRHTPAIPHASGHRPPTPSAQTEQALDYIRQQIEDGKTRPTINDLVRLLEIRQRQHPTDIVACWYSPTAPQGTCPVCLRPSDPAATERFRAILTRHRALTEQDQP